MCYYCINEKKDTGDPVKFRKSLFVILLTKIAFSSQSFAVEDHNSGQTRSAGPQKTYQFTRYFTQKFKEGTDQQAGFELNGAAASSVMGPTNLAGGKVNFDANYWSFIDSLSSSTGTSSTETAAAPTCDGIIITSPTGEKGYLPPGIEGKRSAALGKSYRCEGTGWVETNADGTAGSVGLRTASCESQTFTAGSCSFTFPDATHLETVFDGYGQLFGDNINLEGNAKAQCVNGTMNLVSATCRPVACAGGETVTWRGVNFNTQHEEYPRCQGEVTESGFVTARTENQFFSDIESARTYTKDTNGIAQFACTSKGWQLMQGSPSTCIYTPPQDLNCGKPGFAGDKELYLCN